MDKKTLYMIIFIVLAVVFTILINILKVKRYKTLVRYLEKKEFDNFYLLIDDFYTKALFPPFNLDFMKLNSAILRNDQKLTEESFAVFDKRRLSKKQKEAVYMMAFNYFISLEKYDMAKKYVDLISTIDNAQMNKEVKRIYDIYALKGYKYLHEMIEEVEMMEDTYKGVNEFLISLMYENKKDLENAEKYKKLSEKHMQLLDKKIREK